MDLSDINCTEAVSQTPNLTARCRAKLSASNRLSTFSPVSNMDQLDTIVVRRKKSRKRSTGSVLPTGAGVHNNNLSAPNRQSTTAPPVAVALGLHPRCICPETPASQDDEITDSSELGNEEKKSRGGQVPKIRARFCRLPHTNPPRMFHCLKNAFSGDGNYIESHSSAHILLF